MTRLRVLITGGTGLLGKSLLETAPAGWEVHATFHRNPPPAEWRDRFHPLDLEDAGAAGRLVRELRPEAVIHTASVGSVDEADRDPVRVRQVNVEGTRAMAHACRRAGAFLVHISSNAVFDGLHPPYSENSPLCPVNRYGQIKMESEQVARDLAGDSCLIVRPILMYGWPLPGGRDNAVTRWLSSLEEGRGIEAACDIFSMPLSAASCARTLWAGLRQGRSGIVHVAGADRLSLFDFARRVAQLFGHNAAAVSGVPAQAIRGFVRRPPDSSFITRRMEEDFGVRPIGVLEGLSSMLRCRSPSAVLGQSRPS